MNTNLEIVGHYYSLDELDEAMDILVDAGLSPTSQEEARSPSDGDGGVYALFVPENQLEQAEAILETKATTGVTEEEGARAMFSDYEKESDELRESYRET